MNRARSGLFVVIALASSGCTTCADGAASRADAAPASPVASTVSPAVRRLHQRVESTVDAGEGPELAPSP